MPPHDLLALARAHGAQAAAATVARRRGRGYDPEVVDGALVDPEPLLRAAAAPDVWERVMALEPQPVVTIPQAALEPVLRALGDFVDLKVADLRLAGFVHDLGRMAVPNGISEKAGPLSDREWERVRLDGMVRAGTLDKRTVNAVLEAAGARATRARRGYPAGLTDREVEVVRLIAQGRTNPEIAQALVIADKTVDAHAQHIHAKAGVSTRVGAALFAMQHALTE